MTTQPVPEQPSYRPNPGLKKIETGFESLLFNSRWLMAPFYSASSSAWLYCC